MQNPFPCAAGASSVAASISSFGKSAKMLALGIETSTRVGQLALVKDDRLLVEDVIDAELDHSGKLLTAVRSALSKAGLSRDDLDCIGVGTGPGSLTGVRVGIAFAKGLVFATGKPLVGVCSLESIAYRRKDYTGVLSIVVDAKMRGFYHAAYRWSGAEVKEVSSLSVFGQEELPRNLSSGALILSPDTERLGPELLAHLPPSCRVEREAVFPSAEHAARQAMRKVSSGLFDPQKMVEPIYLRPGVITPPRLAR